MLLFNLCKVYLEFLISLSTNVLIGIGLALILIGIFIDGDFAKSIALLLAVFPLIFYLFGMFAGFLKGCGGAWFIFTWLIYASMDISVLVLLVMLVGYIARKISNNA